ncbi:propionate catabolism operon regulatory protein PrpR [Methylonatrum kenyense]|uniref:propionate catabolism operon regulatory protein PrpR n=1 Tax=Methylonatrum kenyense TaxID=455253 RepID=UPI0020BE9145|nr:propionate catabolism operon regulatory protein PrpR [Methylonatrum kenyense]
MVGADQVGPKAGVPRIPRIVAISYKGLTRLINSVIPHYRGIASIRTVDKVFDEAVAAAEGLIAANEVDVIISAGANASYLRERLSAPVIRINVSAFDILRAMLKARNLSDKVALITYRETDAELQEVKQLINLDIEQRSYTTIEDARLQFRELKAEGYGVIVGSSFITDLSESEGLTGILAYSPQAVHQAVDAAIEVARTQHIEKTRRNWLDQVIRHLNEGVIAVDPDERVQCFNPASERILGVSADKMLNRRLSELLPSMGLRDTLASQEVDLHQIIRVGSRLLMASRVPLMEYGVNSGAVITFQDSTSIENADRNIRSQRRTRHYTAKYHLEEIIGESRSLGRVCELARQYAASESTVLLTGDSGTGKELFAQGIHNASPRAGGRFVAVNCAAFAESLLESELFGYEEGAFTGARKGGRTGLIEAAHGGTLFLDEIGDMPINLQTRLLRVLQEREVMRLGGTLAAPVDVRVIAATNVDLKERMISGEMREDLYYRLNILVLQIPPLRERGDDVLVLADYLLRRHLTQMGCDRDPRQLLEMLEDKLRSYSWPGNVRELENLAERLAVFFMHADGWSREQYRRALYSVVPELVTEVVTDDPKSLKAERERIELNHIQRVVAECDGSLPEAAKRLGVSRTTLWRKLNRANAARARND